MTAPIPPPPNISPIFPPTQPLAEPKQSKQRLSCGTWFGIAILCVGFACCGTLLFSHYAQTFITIFGSRDALGSPLSVENGFYNSLISHNYARAYSYLAPGLAAKYPQSELATRWQALEKHTHTVKIINSSAYIESADPRTADGYVKLVQTLGEWQFTISEVKMNKIDGEWKIEDAQPSLIPPP